MMSDHIKRAPTPRAATSYRKYGKDKLYDFFFNFMVKSFKGELRGNNHVCLHILIARSIYSHIYFMEFIVTETKYFSRVFAIVLMR